mgnify:FL=1|tara:strand:+ start:43537 stop:45159 length:1623 start_codon:yes stop_codon:yes gene_type:complete
MKIGTIDVVIILVYLVGIVAVGLLSARSKEKMTGEGYFLAGRGLKWGSIGAALFASNISTIHLTGLAAEGYRVGLVAGNYEWMATFTLLLLAMIFAPFYIKTKISTLPEFLEKRYDSRSRTILAIIAIIGALFIHIGISLYAGAIVFEKFFGLDIYVSIIGISVITAIYTVAGGLKAVVITENIQTVILLLGSIILTGLAIVAVQDTGIETIEQLKAALKPDQLKMLHSGDSEIGKEGMAWYMFFLGYPILGIWYWCTDQTIVQRVLGAKTVEDAQKGALFAGVLKFLPPFILILPGTLAYVLFQQDITDPNQALPVLINELLPTGLKGIFAAALLAALMSTIAAALNSCSSLVALDVVKRVKPNLSDDDQVKIGRYTAVGVMIIAILWSTQGDKFGSIFEAINNMAGALAPPVATVFLLGVFYKKGTKDAAFYTLLIGLILGITLFLIDFKPISGASYITDMGIPFLMRTWWVFCICCVLYLIISAITPKSDPEVIAETTFANPSDIFKRREGKTGLQDIRVLAGLLFAALVILYSVFG